MTRSYKESKIGSAVAGDTGMPGSGYSALWVGVAHYADDEFEARAKWARGSNQGYLEEHESLSTQGRGSSPDEALEIIREDVLEWDCGSVTVPERRAALRECLYEAQDWLKEQGECVDGHESWKKDPLVCLGCGSEKHLKVMLWVNPVTGQVDWSEPCFETYDDPKGRGIQSQYCEACSDDKGAVLKSEWDKKEVNA